jgi:glutamate-1-semialdehyde 2,1-aminomutase
MGRAMSITKDEPLAPGVSLHPREEQRYRERTPRSRELLEKARGLIPTGHAGGMWYQLPYPVLLERGEGTQVWDVDGNEYVDMRIGDWVMMHGHSDPHVRDAITAQLGRAGQFGCPEWDLAYRLGSLIQERMPSVEKIRFQVSGTETNLLALRLARAHTGRTKLAKATGSYHGIADILIAGTPSIRYVETTLPPGVTKGVAQDVVEYPFNDLAGTEEVLTREAGNVAAVIVEPVMGAAGMIPATHEFLHGLREVTQRLGIVLIFDEVVTFPMAYGGAQAYYGVRPDLTTMSKAIGGGLPAAALGGSAEIMDLLEPTRHAGRAPITAASTFGGNVTAMAAGIACVEQLTPEVHEHVAALGERLRAGIDEIGRRHGIPLHATGAGHLSGLHWAEERVVDHGTRMQDDDEKITNLVMALMNEGWFTFSFGYLLINRAFTAEQIDDFHEALERALRAVELVG